jgi:hypothetical protein
VAYCLVSSPSDEAHRHNMAAARAAMAATEQCLKEADPHGKDVSSGDGVPMP